MAYIDRNEGGRRCYLNPTADCLRSFWGNAGTMILYSVPIPTAGPSAVVPSADAIIAMSFAGRNGIWKSAAAKTFRPGPFGFFLLRCGIARCAEICFCRRPGIKNIARRTVRRMYFGRGIGKNITTVSDDGDQGGGREHDRKQH